MTTTEHAVAHEHGQELVCSCGMLLSNYGLTRTLHSLWAQHIRDARQSESPESFTVDQIREAFAKHASNDDWGVPSFYEKGLIAALRGEYDDEAVEVSA